MLKHVWMGCVAVGSFQNTATLRMLRSLLSECGVHALQRLRPTTATLRMLRSKAVEGGLHGPVRHCNTATATFAHQGPLFTNFSYIESLSGRSL